MRRRVDSTARAGGFTLVELVVVLIVVGLIGTVATTNWIALLPNQQFNTAVRNLSEVLYGTRSDAIARNREFRVYYYLDDEEYAVRTPFLFEGGLAQSDSDESAWIRRANLKDSGIDIVSVTVDDETYTNGDVIVSFSPLGASSHHVIELRQEQGARLFTIEVLPLTGEIRFHDGAYERDPPDDGDFQ